MKRRIEKPVKNLRWSDLQNYPSQIFEYTPGINKNQITKVSSS